MAQVKVLFYIPRQDNDGRDLSAEVEDLKDDLFFHFDGWTFLGFVQGAYRMDDGTKSIDVSGAYILVLDDARLAELERVLLAFKSRTTQEAIYLEIQRDLEVRFLR
jgi:hypothetical protein